MYTWLELLKNDDYLGIKKYIKSGADLSDTNEVGESVLACALREKCDVDTLMLLIENGADIFDFDEEGVSILDMAITYDYSVIVKHLIAQGKDVNDTTRKSGFTALMAAACYGRVAIAKILLENGADKDIRDMKGFTALDFARKMNKKSILELLEYDENSPKNTGYAR
ncbi:ankyrin repeat domain-containing protein [Sulfurimonas sp.]